MTNLSSMISQSGYGIGEINAIDTPSNATGWGISGLGMTVGTTTTSTDLPLEGMVTTAVKLTPDAGGTGYAYRRFTISEALKGYNLKLEWWQRCSANYTSGDLKVDLYYYADSGYTSGTRIVPLNGATTTNIVKTNGKFTLTFAAPTSTVYLEIRVTRVSGVSPIALSVVTVGPGIQPQGAVVGPSTDYGALTITGVTSNPTKGGVTKDSFFVERVGDVAYCRWAFSQSGSGGAAGSGAYLVNLPSGLTFDSTKILAGSVLGTGYAYISGFYSVQAIKQTGVNAFYVHLIHDTANVDWASTTFPLSGAVNFEINLRIPIAEWSGSGTVQLAQNDVEYAWNSTTTATVGTYTSNKGYGSAGTPILAYSLAGTASAGYEVGFQTPIQPTDSLLLELSEGANPWWTPAGTRLLPTSNEAGTSYRGMVVIPNGTSTAMVYFRNVPNEVQTWPAYVSGNFRWRVRKTSAGAAVGFGLASADSAGLVSREASQSLSGTLTGATTTPTVTAMISRIGNQVTMTINDFGTVTKNGAGSLGLSSFVPVGYRPLAGRAYATMFSVNATRVLVYGDVDNLGHIRLFADIAGNTIGNGIVAGSYAPITWTWMII